MQQLDVTPGWPVFEFARREGFDQLLEYSYSDNEWKGWLGLDPRTVWGQNHMVDHVWKLCDDRTAENHVAEIAQTYGADAILWGRRPRHIYSTGLVVGTVADATFAFARRKSDSFWATLEEKCGT